MYIMTLDTEKLHKEKTLKHNAQQITLHYEVLIIRKYFYYKVPW
jgi:hypothetical protein